MFNKLTPEKIFGAIAVHLTVRIGQEVDVVSLGDSVRGYNRMERRAVGPAEALDAVREFRGECTIRRVTDNMPLVSVSWEPRREP